MIGMLVHWRRAYLFLSLNHGRVSQVVNLWQKRAIPVRYVCIPCCATATPWPQPRQYTDYYSAVKRGSKILCRSSRYNPLLPLSRPQSRSEACPTKRKPSPIASLTTVPHGLQVLYRNSSGLSIMTGCLIASDQTHGTLASACKEQDSSPCQINCEFEMDGAFAGTSGSLYHAFFSLPGPHYKPCYSRTSTLVSYRPKQQ